VHRIVVFGPFIVGLLLIAGSLKAESLVRISAKEPVYQIEEVDDRQILVGMESGLYRVRGRELIPIMTRYPVTAIAQTSRRIWFGMSCHGLFYADRAYPVGQLQETSIRHSNVDIGDGCITQILNFGDDVWVGTRKSLYRISLADDSVRVFEDIGWVNSIKAFEEELWIGTSLNIFRLDTAGEPVQMFSARIAEIVEAGGGIWFITAGGVGRMGYGTCFRFDGEKFQPFLDEDRECVSVAYVRGEMWFATAKGIMRFVASSPEQIARFEGLRINSISLIDKEVWVGATNNVFRELGSGRYGVVPSDAESAIEAQQILARGGRIWVRAYTGLYLLEEGEGGDARTMKVSAVFALVLLVIVIVLVRQRVLLPVSSLEVGDVLARRYKITEHVGAGAMGQVFLATDMKMSRQVALKCPVESMPKKSIVKEVKILANLNNEYIVTAYDFVQQRGVSCLVMEYVQGKTLFHLMRHEIEYCQSELKTIIRQICSGLAEAHAQGVIHRDIKPQNIILEEKSGDVRIVDFGVAKLLPQPSMGTVVGTVVGTPCYMAPEVVSGGKVDTRADLYSLGVILWEIATGQPLEMPKEVILISKDRFKQGLSETNSVTGEFKNLILSCVSNDPENRPGSAKDLLFAISKICLWQKPSS
jgi:predicted Ser/Thr protein kinase